jgi:hypothetical protein
MWSVKCKTAQGGKQAAVAWVDTTLIFFLFLVECEVHAKDKCLLLKHWIVFGLG